MNIKIDIKKQLNTFNLDINLDIDLDKDKNINIYGLLGASGDGKSATLKCLCGIYNADSGIIKIDDEVIYDSENNINISPKDRKIGYLFQNYALFPHINVIDNILVSLPLRKRNFIKKHFSDNIDDIDLILFQKYTKMLGIDDKLYAMPRSLSGGESQRVAIARLLMSKPKLIILDEPFSAIDAHMKEKLQLDFITLINRLEIPTIMVSHSREEVYRMCDYISIIYNGVIIEEGYTKEVFNMPKSKIAAIVTGCKNVFEVEQKNGKIALKNYEAYIDVNMIREKMGIDINSIKYIGVRAHDFTINKTESTIGSIVLSNANIIEDQFETVVYANGIWFKCDKNLVNKDNIPEQLYLSFDKIMLLTK